MVSLHALLRVATATAAVHAASTVASTVAIDGTTDVATTVASLVPTTTKTLASTASGHEATNVIVTAPHATLTTHLAERDTGTDDDTGADDDTGTDDHAKPALSKYAIGGISAGAVVGAVMLFSFVRYFLMRLFNARDHDRAHDAEKGNSSPAQDGGVSVHSPTFMPPEDLESPAPVRVAGDARWTYLTTVISLDSVPPAHKLADDYGRTKAEALVQNYHYMDGLSGIVGTRGSHEQSAGSEFVCPPSPVKTAAFPSPTKPRDLASSPGQPAIASPSSSYSAQASITRPRPARSVASGPSRSRSRRSPRAFHAL